MGDFTILKVKGMQYKDYRGMPLLVPGWAKWGAVDEDGKLWVYERKPGKCHFSEGFNVYCNHRPEIICTVIYSGNWEDSVARLMTSVFNVSKEG